MRKPSARVLTNRVDVYVFHETALDADGGVDAPNAYSATPDYAAVPATVQIDGGERVVDDQNRVTSLGTGVVALASPPDYTPGLMDMLVWVDPAGATHALFVGGSFDNAGRGAMVTLSVTERT